MGPKMTEKPKRIRDRSKAAVAARAAAKAAQATIEQVKEAPKAEVPTLLSEGEESLPVPLTDAELLEYGAALAHVESEIRAHEEHIAFVKTGLKARESELTSRRAEIAQKVRARKENRQIPVQQLASYKRGVAETFRMDTGEKIRERYLSLEERQISLIKTQSKAAQKVADSHEPKEEPPAPPPPSEPPPATDPDVLADFAFDAERERRS